MKRYSSLFIRMAGLVLLPATAWANGVSPILNFFHPDMWKPATVVMLVIILIETGLLRWWLRNTTWRRALWIAVLINVVSSCTGSILLLLFGMDSYFVWDTGALLLPLFLITLLTEIPLLHRMARTIPLTWKRAVLIGLGMNLLSYTGVVTLEIGGLAVYMGRAASLDRQETAEWQNPRLLERFSGNLYATTSGPGQHSLSVFDPAAQSWIPLTNTPSFEPHKWDVEGDLCAYIGRDKHDLFITRMPGFSILHQISTDPFTIPQREGYSHWQGFMNLTFSPDGKRLAVLFRNDDAVAYKNRSSHYNLGAACRLIVLDVGSGAEIDRAPRWASDKRLAWLPDSQTVLFSSYDDESLYDTKKSEVKGSTRHGVPYTKEGPFSSGLYAFHLDNGIVSRFTDGQSPSLATVAGQVLVRENDTIKILDPSGAELSRFELPRVRRAPILSPDGKLLFVESLRHSPFVVGGVPIICTPSDPDIRHGLPNHMSYRYDWTAVPEPASRPDPLPQANFPD